MHLASYSTVQKEQIFVLALIVAQQAPGDEDNERMTIASNSPIAIKEGRLYSCLAHTRHTCTLEGCSYLRRLLSHPLALSYVKDGAIHCCPPALR